MNSIQWANGIDPHANIAEAHAKARDALLAERCAQGYWVGALSSSALSTATAVCALSLADPENRGLVEGGLKWLAEHLNVDGGWGDTIRSKSNLSTTVLGWAAFGAVPGVDHQYRSVMDRVERWLIQHAGGLAPERLAPAVIRRYGEDRTFSVPILTMSALAGRLGPGPEAWQWVIPLPFELAALPQAWFAWLQLPVVSYALPALIAMGQVRYHYRRPGNPLARLVRALARKRTLKKLASLQPVSGGFLEATPLTSFVVMSLIGIGQTEHPVTRLGLQFLRQSVLADGSWPIDTNLATWLTTLSVNALDHFPGAGWDARDRQQIGSWLLRQQYRTVHPYTLAAPGGWAWTDLPGGVPDADDTAGALLALRHLDPNEPSACEAAAAGITWLMDLQNRDGGLPTFCRGWGKLPFDRSSPDLTAHALRAWLVWRPDMPVEISRRLEAAIARALRFLGKSQSAEGSWSPLWFGNEHSPTDENPVYGTSRVIVALSDAGAHSQPEIAGLLERAVQWLCSAQNAQGGWSGFVGGPASIEETALAVEALTSVLAPLINLAPAMQSRVEAACRGGALWLAAQVCQGQWRQPAPIGFYFARLWYYEKLYPLIFTVGALGKALRVLNPQTGPK
jgi:squalene-hopene/tetraprenyl-beta-curcumene cyclase